MKLNKYLKGIKNVRSLKRDVKPLSQREIVRFVESHCHICQHTVTSRIDLVPNHCLKCGRTDWLKERSCCKMCDYYHQLALEAQHENYH